MSKILFRFGDGGNGCMSECVDTRDIINFLLPTATFDAVDDVNVAVVAVNIFDLCSSPTLPIPDDIVTDCVDDAK